MSDSEVLGTLAEAFERMSAGTSPTGNYFFAVNASDAAASLKRAVDRADGYTIAKEAYDGDIVSRLRNWRGLHLAHEGRLFDEAAGEIERLRGDLEVRRLQLEAAAGEAERERLQPADSGYTAGISAGADSKPTLTDEERASVVRAIETLEGVEYLDAFSTKNDATAAATLRGLLERLGVTERLPKEKQA
jgi:hypothetical protein